MTRHLQFGRIVVSAVVLLAAAGFLSLKDPTDANHNESLVGLDVVGVDAANNDNTALAVGVINPCNSVAMLTEGGSLAVDIVVGSNGVGGLTGGLRGFDFYLHWDNRQLTYSSHQIPGMMLGSASSASDFSSGPSSFGAGGRFGRYHFVGALTGGTPNTGDGVLVRVTFTAVTGGTVDLSEVFVTFQDVEISGVHSSLQTEFPDRHAAGAFPDKSREGYLLVATNGTIKAYPPGDDVRRATIAVSPATCPVADADGDGIGDGLDNCPYWANPSQALPPWTVPANDWDCDGWSNADEGSIGTNPLRACGAVAWPPDFNDDGLVDTQDVLALAAPAFFKFKGQPGYSERLDIMPDEVIDTQDVLKLGAPIFFKFCTN